MTDQTVFDTRDLLQDMYLWDRENRLDADSDLLFLAGDQWPDTVRAQRVGTNRPTLTINRLPTFVHQVTNDIRQNAPATKVVPVDSVTDPAVAKIYTGLVRQIEYQSAASNVYANASFGAVACGMGHWRIDTDFIEDSVFEQEIKIRRIQSPLSVYWSPGAIEPAREDGSDCIITEMMPLRQFRSEFSGANESDMQRPDERSDGDGLFWRSQDGVRVAEHWRKVPMKRRLMAFQNESGDISTIDATDLTEQQLFFLPEPFSEREADGHRVEQLLVSGAEVLDGPNKWAGRFIPIITVIGGEIPLSEKTIRHGLVRFARDPQQLYNYFRSAAAEAIALAPKSPFMATSKQIGTGKQKAQWDSAHTTNRPYMLYTHDSKAPGPPKRERPADPPNALWQEGALAGEDLKNTMGIFDASLGARSNETSGRAILARQREGDTGTFHFTDNLAHSMRHSGRVLVDLIPRIYDNERIVTILKEDDTEQFVPINTEVFTEDGMSTVLHDLGAGRFNVRVTTGPSYTTKRIEAADSMVAFVQAVPGAAAVVADLIAKNQDWPGAEEIAERLRRLVPAEVLGEEEGAPTEPDPQTQIVNELLLRGQAADVATKEAKAAKTAAEAGKVEADTQQVVAAIEKMSADFARIMSTIGLTEAQTDKIEADIENVGARTDAQVLENVQTQRTVPGLPVEPPVAEPAPQPEPAPAPDVSDLNPNDTGF